MSKCPMQVMLQVQHATHVMQKTEHAMSSAMHRTPKASDKPMSTVIVGRARHALQQHYAHTPGTS